MRARHVWRRDLDVFLHTWWTNFLPPILEPILYLVAFGAGMGTMIGAVSWGGRSVSYVTFLAPGLISIAIMFWAFFETLYGSFVRMYYQKTFEAIISTPLTLEDVIVGEMIWGATKSVIVTVLMMIAITFFGVLQYPQALLVIPFSLLSGLMFAALGMCFTAICPTIDTFNLPIFGIIYPMFLFSGTFFPLEVLPSWARLLAGALPLTHTAFFVRSVCFGDFGLQLIGSVLYTAALGAILFWLALILMRRRLIR
jgi:lipooligosaccharide transport system permease protein